MYKKEVLYKIYINGSEHIDQWVKDSRKSESHLVIRWIEFSQIRKDADFDMGDLHTQLAGSSHLQVEQQTQ